MNDMPQNNRPEPDEEGGTSIIDSPFSGDVQVAPARLVVVAGPSSGKSFLLTERSAKVGRGDDCDVVLDDPSVSRRHVRVEAVADRWFAQDLGSGNGTYVGGTRTDRFPLTDGVVFSLGASAVRFERLGPVVAADEPEEDATRMVSIDEDVPDPLTADTLSVAATPRLQIAQTAANQRLRRKPRWLMPLLVGVLTACVVAGLIWLLTGFFKPEPEQIASAPEAAPEVDRGVDNFERATQAIEERRWDAALHILQSVETQTPDHEGLPEAKARAKDERRNMQVLAAAKRVLERDDTATAEVLGMLSRIDAASIYHEEAATLTGEISNREIANQIKLIREMVQAKRAAAARDAFTALAEAYPDGTAVQALRAELEAAGILGGTAERVPTRPRPAAPATVGRGDLTRASALYNSGDFDRALAALEDVTNADSGDLADKARQMARRIGRFSSAYREGTRALMDKRLESARSNLLKALSADASLTHHYESEIRGMLGEVCRGLAAQALERGDCAVAAKRAREVLSYRPGDNLANRILEKCPGE